MTKLIDILNNLEHDFRLSDNTDKGVSGCKISVVIDRLKENTYKSSAYDPEFDNFVIIGSYIFRLNSHGRISNTPSFRISGD